MGLVDPGREGVDRSSGRAKLCCAIGADVSKDLINAAKAGDWIVCGWFTPDYRHWAETLIGDLERLGNPYHFEAVAKAKGGWSANTLMKADVVLRSLNRYPGKRIVLLDVDCRVFGDLAPLAALPCDVAFFLRSRQRKDRWYSQLRPKANAPQTFLQPRSGTMLFAATDAARNLVERWSALSKSARAGQDDESTLAMALGEGTGLALCALETKWAAIGPGVETKILHTSAHVHSQS